jgi:hypothetical protein
LRSRGLFPAALVVLALLTVVAGSMPTARLAPSPETWWRLHRRVANRLPADERSGCIGQQAYRQPTAKWLRDRGQAP